MKKNKFIKFIIGFVLGFILCISADALTLIPSNLVTIVNNYTNKNILNSAVDELYSLTKIGTAAASNILSGKTAVVAGKLITGTMTNRGAVSTTINSGGSYTIPAGYHNGSGKVTVNSLASQTSATASAGNILYGQTAWVNGSKLTGTLANNGNQSKTVYSTKSGSIPAGYTTGGTITASHKGIAIAVMVTDNVHGLSQSNGIVLDSIASNYVSVASQSSSSTQYTAEYQSRYVQYKVLKNCTIEYSSAYNGRGAISTVSLAHNSTTLYTSSSGEQKNGTINAKTNDTITFRSSGSSFQTDLLLLKITP